MPPGDDAASIRRQTSARGLDHAWRWRVRLRMEQYPSVVRAVTVCVVLVVWRAHGPVPGVGPVPVWIVGAAAVLCTVADGVVPYRMPQLAPRASGPATPSPTSL